MPFWRLLAIVFLLTACAGKIDQRGNALDPDGVAGLKPGVSTKSDVLLAFGSPSSVSTFDSNIWYYISQKTERRAFLHPKVTDQYILALSFDGAEKLDALYATGFDQYQELETIKKATPTAGKKMSILEQLVGNVGRFNKGKTGKK
ncbi:MAG: outer membrane protein assembly factor BamE [Holosporales bacterium]|jgi:outer membrane protein assembly factor BamE (lipoprotein component of BamABCDE complex)